MTSPQENESGTTTELPNGATTMPPQGDAAEMPPADDAPPIKRGRGRPPKNANPNIQKETPSGAAPRRGRPPKSDKKVYTTDEIALMGKQLVGIHVMVAQITGIHEIQIHEQEGALLAQSIVNVADQYDLAIDGKTGAALQLIMTAAMIYGPRALSIRARARAQQPQADSAQGNG